MDGKTITTVASKKGGVGKSTLAFNLAVMRARLKRRVHLIDCDPDSRTSYELCGFRAEMREADPVNAERFPDLAVSQAIGKLVSKTAIEQIKFYDDIVLDLQGKDGEELYRALAIAHVIVIPSGASQIDVQVLPSMDAIIEQIQTTRLELDRPPARAIVVFSRAPVSPFSREIEDARAYVEANCPHLTLARTIIRDRSTYRLAPRMGRGVVEMDRVDPKAREEMLRLMEEIYGETAHGAAAA